MWAKISGALKRPETPAQEHFDIDDRPPTVLSTVFDHHPNLSNFHDPSEVPFPSPSPPASPSKHGRRGIFKRNGKSGDHDQGSISLKISIPQLKKVKSSLHGSSSEYFCVAYGGGGPFGTGSYPGKTTEESVMLACPFDVEAMLA